MFNLKMCTRLQQWWFLGLYKAKEHGSLGNRPDFFANYFGGVNTYLINIVLVVVDFGFGQGNGARLAW